MAKLILLFSILISLGALCQTKGTTYTLNSFLKKSESLDGRVDQIFNEMSTDVRVAQLLMPAVGKYGLPEDSIINLVKLNKIGGILLLNGTKEQFTNWVVKFNSFNTSGNLPFLYSADAEPSLVNRKIIGSTPVPKANEIDDIEDVKDVTLKISNDLNDIGINYNFSPVVDVAQNKTVGYRGFGKTPENIIPFSNEFITISQQKNIIATAKHFPGHGLVSGDTHKALQMIDGELREIHNYPPLIENGVLSIMVAHIAVKNNTQYATNGMPSTTSRKIVTELLRDSLQFKGLIVTDAMNMGGVTQVKDAAIKAIEAGCDIVLMPLKTSETHYAIKNKYESNKEFENIADIAIKRIIRMKICLGLIK